ncbi:MAG TPA: hypothetical protein VMA54_12115 [Steroidobacteraceae bacterium]|nr:hypothetical protein [Steroidobacteraceae bacterium]
MCPCPIILRHQQFTIGIQHIREIDRPAQIGRLGLIAHVGEREDLAGQFFVLRLELHERREAGTAARNWNPSSAREIFRAMSTQTAGVDGDLACGSAAYGRRVRGLGPSGSEAEIGTRRRRNNGSQYADYDNSPRRSNEDGGCTS